MRSGNSSGSSSSSSTTKHNGNAHLTNSVTKEEQEQKLPQPQPQLQQLQISKSAYITTPFNIGVKGGGSSEEKKKTNMEEKVGISMDAIATIAVAAVRNNHIQKSVLATATTNDKMSSPIDNDIVVEDRQRLWESAASVLTVAASNQTRSGHEKNGHSKNTTNNNAIFNTNDDTENVKSNDKVVVEMTVPKLLSKEEEVEHRTYNTSNNNHIHHMKNKKKKNVHFELPSNTSPTMGLEARMESLLITAPVEAAEEKIAQNKVVGGGGDENEEVTCNSEDDVRHCTPTKMMAMTTKTNVTSIGLKDRMEALLLVTKNAESESTKSVHKDDNTAIYMNNEGSNTVEEEKDDMYQSFVSGLRREVAGDHTQLWAGFQSLCGRSTKEHVLLHRIDEKLAYASVTGGSDNGDVNYNDYGMTNTTKPKKKKKKIKMDPLTQESLTRIHQQLLENERIKGRFMTSNSQLVNDKRYRKESRMHRSTTRSSHEEEEEEEGDKSLARWEDDGSTPAQEGTKELKTSPWRSIPSSSLTNTYSSSTPITPKTKHSSPTHKQSHNSPLSTTKLQPVSGRSISSGRTHLDGDCDNVKEGGDMSTASDIRGKPSWMEALKLKQKTLLLNTTHSDDTSFSIGSGGHPSPNLSNGNGSHTLRRVVVDSPRKRSRMSPMMCTASSKEPSWSNVQLRSTPSMSNRTATTPHSSSSSLIAYTSSYDMLSPKNHTTIHHCDAPTSLTLPSLFCSVGDIINLDALPMRDFPPEEGEVAIYPLKQQGVLCEPPNGGGRGTEEEEEVTRYVIVGRSVIVTANAVVPFTSTSGPRKARVTWGCRRCEIRALTLNVEATGADLAHKHGRTPLLFESANVCLDFAQTFYRGPTTTVPPATLSVTVDGKARVFDGRGGDDESNAHKERSTTNVNQELATYDVPNILAEDEKKLLDHYRQFSQSDRTKLRLTCLSPQGEMQEMEVTLSPLSSGMGITPHVDPTVETTVPASSDAAPTMDVGKGGSQHKLSPKDELVASKYRKMLHMGIPHDTVRHKMLSDEIVPTVIAAVLGETESSAGQHNRLTNNEETIATKYCNMMKMGVPIDGVRHKMTMEGVCDKVITAVCDVSPPPPPAAAGVIHFTGNEEAIASKYRKMLKVGVPLDDVKHKMNLDGIDLKIISVLVREASLSLASGVEESVNADPPTKISKVGGPTLSKEEEAIATKYRNMLKVCIPKDAIRHGMKKEGVIDKIVDAVLGKEVDGGRTGPDNASIAKAYTKKTKTIAFHWTTSNLAPELLEKSIFGRTELKKRKLVSTNPEELDIKKLEEVFQKRQNNATTKKNASQEETNDMANLLDLTRANNVAISLKAFNDFTFRSLAETINDIDPDCKIDSERVQFIPNLLPTANEIQAIQKFSGEDEKLIPAELFFRQLVPIKRIDDKVKVIQAMSTFDENVKEVRAGFKTLQKVCGQIMDSEKLIQVLEMVLNIGNLMNAGTLDGGVEAFKFESLPKLSQTKSADGKTTILDYIVESFIEKGDREILLLVSEFPTIQDSCRLSICDLMNDLNSLRNDYKQCKSELTSMKRDQSSKRVTRSMSKKINNECYVDDPKGALFAAIKSRISQKTDVSSTSSDPRQALFAAIQNKKRPESAETDADSPTSDVQYTPGVHHLQKFLNYSKSILSLAENDQDGAVRACKGLAVYCGEEGGERSAPALLQVLSNFAQSLESGVKKYDQRVETEKRKAAKSEKDKGKENMLKNTIQTPLKMINASTLLPHVGATDKVNVLNTTNGVETVAVLGQDPRRWIDPKRAALQKIMNVGLSSHLTEPLVRSSSAPENSSSKPHQALIASIESRRESLPSQHPPTDSVPERIRHIDTNIARKESRVLLVNRMLSEAPASVKQDFLKGVTYKRTSDPLLKKIYDTEDNAVGDTHADKNWKAVDPRQELLAAIRTRKS